MADEVKWWIDPDSGKLMYPADQYYTAREFASQIGPPCPVCGRRVVVERIAAPQFGASTPAVHPSRLAMPARVRERLG